MRALLLADALALARACATAGVEVVRAESESEARAVLLRETFDLVDGRLARPVPLEGEIRGPIAGFSGHLRGPPPRGLYDAVMREVERPLIASVMARAGGVRADAARVLGIDRGTLARRIRALRIR